MALEALTNPSTIAVQHAIELIRKELAKPEQDKPLRLSPMYEYGHIHDAAQPEQEPVGYFYLRKGVFFHIYEPHNADPEVFPLYTAPPRKKWVGLTDDEINDFDKKLRDNGDYCSLHFAWGISAKLKELNT